MSVGGTDCGETAADGWGGWWVAPIGRMSVGGTGWARVGGWHRLARCWWVTGVGGWHRLRGSRLVGGTDSGKWRLVAGAVGGWHRFPGRSLALCWWVAPTREMAVGGWGGWWVAPFSRKVIGRVLVGGTDCGEMAVGGWHRLYRCWWVAPDGPMLVGGTDWSGHRLVPRRTEEHEANAYPDQCPPTPQIGS